MMIPCSNYKNAVETPERLSEKALTILTTLYLCYKALVRKLVLPVGAFKAHRAPRGCVASIVPLGSLGVRRLYKRDAVP